MICIYAAMFCTTTGHWYVLFFLFFFKQKTAYEMRISDGSSDVCSSDLAQTRGGTADARGPVETRAPNAPDQEPAFEDQTRAPQPSDLAAVTTSTVEIGRASCRERVCQYV